MGRGKSDNVVGFEKAGKTKAPLHRPGRKGKRMETNLAYKFEEWREETIGGKVVMMATPGLNHSFIVGNIYNLFFNYLRGKRCTPFSDNTKLFLPDGEKYIPDVMVVCDPDKLKTNGVHGTPDLVVEVLSHSTAKNDKGRKRDVYEKNGVRE